MAYPWRKALRMPIVLMNFKTMKLNCWSQILEITGSLLALQLEPLVGDDYDGSFGRCTAQSSLKKIAAR